MPTTQKVMTQFELSRIYAQGWNAANGVPSNDLFELGSGKEVAMNPYSNEPERSRWSDGFRKASLESHERPHFQASVPPLTGIPVTIVHTIRYRRPEAPWSVVTMAVSTGAEDALAQKLRLEKLGYSIVDILPPPERG